MPSSSLEPCNHPRSCSSSLLITSGSLTPLSPQEGPLTPRPLINAEQTATRASAPPQMDTAQDQPMLPPIRRRESPRAPPIDPCVTYVPHRTITPERTKTGTKMRSPWNQSRYCRRQYLPLNHFSPLRLPPMPSPSEHTTPSPSTMIKLRRPPVNWANRIRTPNLGQDTPTVLPPLGLSSPAPSGQAQQQHFSQDPHAAHRF